MLKSLEAALAYEAIPQEIAGQTADHKEEVPSLRKVPPLFTESEGSFLRIKGHIFCPNRIASGIKDIGSRQEEFYCLRKKLRLNCQYPSQLTCLVVFRSINTI